MQTPIQINRTANHNFHFNRTSNDNFSNRNRNRNRNRNLNFPDLLHRLYKACTTRYCRQLLDVTKHVPCWRRKSANSLVLRVPQQHKLQGLLPK